MAIVRLLQVYLVLVFLRWYWVEEHWLAVRIIQWLNYPVRVDLLWDKLCDVLGWWTQELAAAWLHQQMAGVHTCTTHQAVGTVVQEMARTLVQWGAQMWMLRLQPGVAPLLRA